MTLYIRVDDPEKTWVTSDLHFGHGWTTKMRYFGTDISAHDEFILKTWEKQVQPGDEVILLGDILPVEPESWFERLRGLPGRLTLVAGNWDRVHSGHPDRAPRESWLRPYGGPFADLDEAAVIGGVDDVSWEASHYPYAKPGSTEARPEDRGKPLLHGHTHSRKKISRSAAGTLQVHVGWDAWRRLIRYDELLAIYKKEMG